MTQNNTIQTLISWFPLLMQGALVTLELAIGAALIGIVLGTIMGIASCRKLAVPGIKHIIKLYVLCIQGTPVFVQVLLFYYALPNLIGVNLSPFAAGIIALGLNSAAYVAEIIRGGINAIPSGQWDACYSLGYASSTTLTAIILPQAIKIILPSLTNELAVLIKETAVISIIGVLELTKVGMNLNAQALDPLMIYGTIALIYLCMTTVLTAFSKHYEQKEIHHD
jgi:polar amino acid transport system permease protein